MSFSININGHIDGPVEDIRAKDEAIKEIVEKAVQEIANVVDNDAYPVSVTAMFQVGGSLTGQYTKAGDLGSLSEKITQHQSPEPEPDMIVDEDE